MFIGALPFDIMEEHYLLFITIIRLLFAILLSTLLFYIWYINKNNNTKKPNLIITTTSFIILSSDFVLIFTSNILLSNDFHSKSFIFTTKYCHSLSIINFILFIINHYFFYQFLLLRVSISFSEPQSLEISSRTMKICQTLIHLAMIQFIVILFVTSEESIGIFFFSRCIH